MGTRSVFGVFRPDLVLRNAGGGEVWEIKSVGEAPLGAVEVVYKSLILNALDPAGGTWVAGSASSYMPPPILDLGAGVIAFVFPPVGGVITYQVLDLKPIVAAVVLYGLCELYSMLAYVEAQPVLAPATCGIL